MSFMFLYLKFYFQATENLSEEKLKEFKDIFSYFDRFIYFNRNIESFGMENFEL